MMTVHKDQGLIELGPDPSLAERVLILLHGRGATAESMLSLADVLQVDGTRIVIPQAYQNRWYPYTAFGPLEVNEPDLSSAIQLVDDLITEAGKAGFDRSGIILGGFSQGACLAAEYVVRNPARYGGLAIFSGAVIGPPQQSRQVKGDLEGTPVFIGVSDVDPWIPGEAVEETSRILEELGGEVDYRIYPGMAHAINQDEIDRVKDLIRAANKPKNN
jgi:predicted esterase